MLSPLPPAALGAPRTALRAKLKLFQHHLRRITPTRAANAASRVDTAAAQIQPINRRFVVRPTREGAHEQELVEHELAVVEVAFGEGVGGFKVKRGERF